MVAAEHGQVERADGERTGGALVVGATRDQPVEPLDVLLDHRAMHAGEPIGVGVAQMILEEAPQAMERALQARLCKDFTGFIEGRRDRAKLLHDGGRNDGQCDEEPALHVGRRESRLMGSSGCELYLGPEPYARVRSLFAGTSDPGGALRLSTVCDEAILDEGILPILRFSAAKLCLPYSQSSVAAFVSTASRGRFGVSALPW